MATQRDESISSTDDTRTVVEIDGRYYILATSSTADQDDQVLKHGESFAIFDRWGDVQNPSARERRASITAGPATCRGSGSASATSGRSCSGRRPATTTRD
jgi:hypothetical protein